MTDEGSRSWEEQQVQYGMAVRLFASVSVGRIVVMADAVKFVGVKEMVKVLQQTEPELWKQLRKDIRLIAAPAVSSIKSQVPTVAPLSGMNGRGRTAWSPVRVTVSVTPMQRSRALGSTTANLAAIMSKGASGQGLVIADMAGRGGGRTRKPVTREYPYKGGTRRHRVDGNGVKKPGHVYSGYGRQGGAMIANLHKEPSRYVYPAIERKLPEIREQVAQSFERTAKIINAKIARI